MNLIESFNVAAEWPEEQGVLQVHYWDEDEPRIVVCQIAGKENSCLVSLLVPTEQEELLVQDVVPMTTDLIGVRLPHYAIVDEATKIHLRLLDSLASLNDHRDKAARDALLSFSCHLRRGRVEQAYQAVRSFAK